MIAKTVAGVPIATERLVGKTEDTKEANEKAARSLRGNPTEADPAMVEKFPPAYSFPGLMPPTSRALTELFAFGFQEVEPPGNPEIRAVALPEVASRPARRLREAPNPMFVKSPPANTAFHACARARTVLSAPGFQLQIVPEPEDFTAAIWLRENPPPPLQLGVAPPSRQVKSPPT